jgi:trehalose 6-phosphate phosphatase
MDDPSRLVEGLRADPPRTAVLLDFDGTLAPIVDDPGQAVPLPDAPSVLSRLHEAFGLVAVISGRPVSHLQAHLPAGPTLVGLYGLEALVGDQVVLHPEAARWRRVVDDVAAAAVAELAPGVGVEHKGLSLTLHVRAHPEMAATVDAWAADVSERTGLLVRRARMSAELHPPIAVDKGTVVDELIPRCAAACFIGDDVGDLPAFDALDRFEAAGGTAVRVVVESAETDPGLLARGDLSVSGPSAVLELLRSLLGPDPASVGSPGR